MVNKKISDLTDGTAIAGGDVTEIIRGGVNYKVPVSTMAGQAANAVAITGGSIVGITDLAIADGGTGASTATAAFNALSPTTTKGDIIVDNGTDAVRLGIGTDGRTLVADSGATNGLAWYNKGIKPYVQSGRYNVPLTSGTLTTHTLTANTIFVVPVIVQKRSTYTAVGFSVSAFTYVATTLNISTAVYADSSGVPGALVAGTTAATAISSTVASATNYDGTFSVPVELTPGIYWLAILADSPSSTTVTAARADASANFTGVSTMANTGGASLRVTRTYGSGFIDPFGTPSFSENAASTWLGLKMQ